MTSDRTELRTEAGMMLRAIFPTRIGFSEQALTKHILAIEAEARQQMKAEVREQIFRDNGLIADPLAAASPAAPDDSRAVELLREVLDPPSDIRAYTDDDDLRFVMDRIRAFLNESGAVPASGEDAT